MHPNLEEPNRSFVDNMWQTTPEEIDNLKTVVYWVFESVAASREQYFFIKNQLFTSNYREKIDGKLCYGGRYQFIEEVDTGDPIEHEADGTLTSESWNKIFEFSKKLNQIYSKEFI